MGIYVACTTSHSLRVSCVQQPPNTRLKSSCRTSERATLKAEIEKHHDDNIEALPSKVNIEEVIGANFIETI